MEFFYYKKGDKYIGVCLTFDIVEEGENLIELKKSLEEGAILHLRVVCKKNLSDDLLNRHAPIKYWERYFNRLDAIKEKMVEDKVKQESTATLSYPWFINERAGCMAS